MRANVRYYLGRVIKIGMLDQQRLIDAIINPTTIERNKYRYTFTDIKIFRSNDHPEGIFARLSKYRPDGAVEVVRPEAHQVRSENVENLIEAASPFVYIPEFSGLAYQHVWNRLQREQFPRLFAELIIAKHSGFFISCSLEPITDMRTFVMRLSKLDTINSIRASIKPPNPLFSPCWKSLNEYMKKRQLDEINVREESQAGINSHVIDIAATMLNTEASADSILKLMEPLMGGVGDAAVLMAADGYGRAKVTGLEGKKIVIIRTSENQKSFLFSRDPEPEELLLIAYEEFKRINDERYLGHG